MEEETTNIVELVDENNEILSFEHIMTLDYDGCEYVVLAPITKMDDTLDDEEVVILRVEQDENGDDYYASIEDDNELDEVFAAVTEVYEKDEE